MITGTWARAAVEASSTGAFSSSTISRRFTKILNILVGDAEPRDLDAMEAAVFGTRAPEQRRIPFEVDSAYQGAEAIEKIRQARAEKRPYALAFVDVRMPPGFDGVETLALIFEEDQDIQAVLCTAYSDWSWSAIAERIDNEGRFLDLKKPFDAAEVRQMAAAMTMKWSEQTALHNAYRRQELLHAATRHIVRAPSPRACAPTITELIGNTLDFLFVALWCRRVRQNSHVWVHIRRVVRKLSRN